MTEEPLILFGAFDRHNFGDLLLGEVAAAMAAPQPAVFAGLAERDFSACGGRKVGALAALARARGDRPARILHVGGEILTCTLYEAAVMLQGEEAAAAAIARYDADPPAGRTWAAGVTGLDRAIAYQVPRELFARPRFVGYLGAGGVGLAGLSGDARREVLAQLARADFIWVRDEETRRQLAAAGVTCLLAPDPAELAASLFGAAIEARALAGEPAAMCRRFPAGYLAAQFSADYGDDATLRAIGLQLLRIQREQGLGIVLFRAGSAPWHDRLDVYRRLAGAADGLDAVLFESLHLLDIGALLAKSEGFIGSSLHGRIVAESFLRPAASLAREAKERSKVGAYVGSWQADAMATVTAPAGLGAAFLASRRRGRELRHGARRRARLAAAAFAALRRAQAANFDEAAQSSFAPAEQ